MELPQLEVVDCGCDWLTSTYKEPELRLMAERRANALVQVEVDAGGIARPWGFHGFEGITAGHTDVGWRDETLLVQLRSETARQHWEKFYELASNVSRFDVQCTTRSNRGSHERVAELWEVARTWANEREGRPEWRIHAGARHGITIETGKPKSDRRGRIYDKHAESKADHYRLSVRHEVQNRNKWAKAVAHMVHSTRYPQSAIAGYLHRFFGKRGISPDIPTGGFETIVFFASATDLDKKLRWMTTQVGPTLRLLVHRGRGAQVLRGCGLTIVNGELVVTGENN